MDIYDIRLTFDISLKKLRHMEKAGVLRVGKSQIPRHLQKVRSDIHKGKLSARSIALVYRYPNEIEKMMVLSARHRLLIEQHIQKAELPKIVPSPVESRPGISTIICGAATEGGIWLERFTEMLKLHIPEKSVEHAYIAVRIYLMCQNQYEINGASEYLNRAILKAKDSPVMEGWWHREKTGGPRGYRTIYHRPPIYFDL